MKQTQIEVDFDLRTLITGQRSTIGLYSTSWRTDTHFTPGLNLVLNGSRKSGDMLANPASSDFVFQQATLEKDWGTHQLQLGLIRLPFGIYNHRETYASGLIDYPLARGDYALNSLDWGVPGLKWTTEAPRFQLEAAVFEGHATGQWSNINNLGGGSLRAQTYFGDMILGISYWNGYLDVPPGGLSAYGTNDIVNGTYIGLLERGAVRESGLDLRYTRPHLLVRGEYLFGTLGGDQMHGWYVDVYYHLPKFRRWTLVTRLEALRPASNQPEGQQATLGVRYTATQSWVFALNWRVNNGSAFYTDSWTPAAGGLGNLYFQAYYRLKL